MDIKRIVVGPVETNCYLLILNNELVVIDPGDEYKKITAEIESTLHRHSREGGNPDLKIIPKYILLTHGHFDHVGAVKELKEKYGFQIILCVKEETLYEDVEGQEELSGMSFSYQGKPDILVKEGDVIKLGKKEIKVMYTPGHTRGSVCYLVENGLFTGDTLFPKRHGMTSFPTGSQTEMDKSLERLFTYPGETKVFPGHYEETNIGEAKKYHA
jgi:glyoxylase-like metal-dependent hydrolase (beta-lactamase superfamily II)